MSEENTSQETPSTTESPAPEKKERAKRGSNTELKFAVTVSADGNDYVFVPPQAEHASTTEVRDALKAFVANEGDLIQGYYKSITDLLADEESASLHFSVIRYLNRYDAKTETVQKTVLTELK